MSDDRPDWGDGDYARTAEALRPAAETLVDAAEVQSEEHVIDIACGTGNVARVALDRGAHVLGVDAAPQLVAQASRLVPGAEFRVGDAEALGVADGAFDVALSAFGVIFAAPGAAAGELVRVLRPGGRLALTTWNPAGAIPAVGGLLQRAVRAPGPGEPARWGDPDWVAELLAAHGARDVATREEPLAFTADSAAAWFDDQVDHHPAWRWGRRRLDDATWEELRRRSVDVLEDANEVAVGFKTTSRYLVVTASRPA